MITIGSVVVLIYPLCVFVVICTSIDAFQPTIDSHYNRNNRFLNPIHTHPTSAAQNQQYHHHQFLNASPNSDDDDKPTTPNYPNRLSAPLSTPTSHPHRSGFLSLIGAPNMGKSTLLNALLSQNLCTVTPRPQTTRHAILGVLTSTDSDQPCQLCFRDTPGVIGEPAYKLQEGMMEAVKGAFVDSDVILVVTDLFGTIIPDDVLFQKVRETDKTVIVVVNKIDLADAHNQSSSNSKSDDNSPYQKTLKISSAVQKWRTLLPSALAIVPLTASSGGSDPGVKALRTLLLGGPDVSAAFRSLGRPVEGMFRAGDGTVKDEDARGMLPDGPPLYGEDAVTDRTERFFASEIIRAALFVNLGKEIPYCCEVRISQFQEPKLNDNKQVTKIRADICVERDSQKGIVVGKGGHMIRDVGVEARKELQEFLQGQVHLSLNVKVDKNWRKDEDKLRAYGYLK